MKTFVLFIGVVVLAGAVAWSLLVLPKESQQAELGAGIGPGLEKSVDISVQAEPAKENAIPVLLEPPQVKAGNQIKITVGAPNPDSVRSIEIFLESPTGLQASQANIWNINGEGQWFGDVPIPQDAEEGTWKIKRIEVTDTQGTVTPYSFGTDIFSTFQVE